MAERGRRARLLSLSKTLARQEKEDGSMRPSTPTAAGGLVAAQIKRGAGTPRGEQAAVMA